MAEPALVGQYSGTVDFDSRSPLLETADGRRWHLIHAEGLLIGDEVTIAAVQLDIKTLDVKAVLASVDPFACP